ncbi:phage major capsid family protein, partial [Eggerthella lenta]
GNLVWMMNRQTKLDLVVEAMDTNMNATIVSGMNDTMPVVGGKVEELKFMADGDIAFGYMTNYKAVQRKGLQLGQSEHVRFLEDQTVFKGT